MITNQLWDMIHGSLSDNDFAQATLTDSENQLLDEFGIPKNEVYHISKPSINPIVWYYKGYIYPLNLFREYLTAMQIQERIKYFRENMDKLELEKNWSAFFGLCDKRMIISQFIKYHKEIDRKEVYDVFIDVWTRAENGFNLFTPDVLQYVFENRFLSDERKDRMTNFLEKCGNKKIKIYHGEQHNGYNVGDLCSWTLSQKVAKFFANRFGNTFGMVYQMELLPTDEIIMDYINDRNEEEVLILPKYWNKPMGTNKAKR